MSNCCLDGLPQPQVGGPATNPFVPCEDIPLVRICHTNQDREMQILCAPDGIRVAVQNITPVDAPLGTAPTFEAWLLNGTAWVGDVATLTDCASENIDVSAPQWFCQTGQNISRTDFWDVSVSPSTLLGSIWQDVDGATIPAPTVGTYTVGACDVAYTPVTAAGNTYGAGSFATPAGATYTTPSNLFGFTVVVLEADNAPVADDYVLITFASGGSISLLQGDIRSWEAPAARYLDAGTTVTAVGNAKHQVTWVLGA